MTDTDNLDVFFLATEQLAYCLGLCLDGASRSFLYEDITVLTMLESKEYKVNSLFQ